MYFYLRADIWRPILQKAKAGEIDRNSRYGVITRFVGSRGNVSVDEKRSGKATGGDGQTERVAEYSFFVVLVS